MEFTDYQTPEQARQQELVERAQASVEVLSDCDEVTARAIIDSLNIQAVTAGLVANDTVLRAAFVMRTHNVMNLKTGGFETTSLPDNSENVLVGGIFVGFEAIRYSGGRALMYRLETGFDPETMSFFAATVPVEGSTLAQRDFVSDEADHVYDTMKESLDILSTVRGKDFKKLFEETIELLREGEEPNEDFFADLGNIVELMLLEPGVSGDDDIEMALTKLIESQIDASALYFLHGQSFIAPKPEERLGGGVDEVQAVTQLSGVQLINDYYIDKKTKKLVIEETQQPAFMIFGSDGIKRIIPLKHLIELSVADQIED